MNWWRSLFRPCRSRSVKAPMTSSDVRRASDALVETNRGTIRAALDSAEVALISVARANDVSERVNRVQATVNEVVDSYWKARRP